MKILILLILLLFISGCVQTNEKNIVIEPAGSSDVILPDLDKDVGTVDVGEEDSERNFFAKIINKMFEGLNS